MSFRNVSGSLPSFFLLTLQRAKRLARWKSSRLAVSQHLFLISECKDSKFFLCAQTILRFLLIIAVLFDLNQVMCPYTNRKTYILRSFKNWFLERNLLLQELHNLIGKSLHSCNRRVSPLLVDVVKIKTRHVIMFADSMNRLVDFVFQLAIVI